MLVATRLKADDMAQIKCLERPDFGSSQALNRFPTPHEPSKTSTPSSKYRDPPVTITGNDTKKSTMPLPANSALRKVEYKLENDGFNKDAAQSPLGDRPCLQHEGVQLPTFHRLSRTAVRRPNRARLSTRVGPSTTA